MMLPLLVLAPHTSAHMPFDILRQMLGDAAFNRRLRSRRRRHLYTEGDPYTEQIFHLPDAHFLPATVSRFVVDLNRYRDDGDANGVIKTVDFSEVSLYPSNYVLTAAERETRLCRYYDSYHDEVARVLQTHDIKLLIDGHSMTPFGPSLGPDRGHARPALTLMTGGDPEGNLKAGQTPSVDAQRARELRRLVEHHFAGLIPYAPVPVVALNEPWDSDEISDMYLARANVPGFGLEINRALYLDDQHTPIDDRVRDLNTAFSCFAREALDLFG